MSGSNKLIFEIAEPDRPPLPIADMVAAGRKTEVKVSAPSIASFLASGPSQLGVSPFLMAWWLGSDEHLAAWFAAEAALTKHYTRWASLQKQWCVTAVLQHLEESGAASLDIMPPGAVFVLASVWAAAAPEAHFPRPHHHPLPSHRFIAETQSFTEAPGVRRRYEELLKVPALVEGV